MLKHSAQRNASCSCMVNPHDQSLKERAVHAIFLSGSSVCLSEVSGAVYCNLSQTSNIFNRHLQCTKIGAYSFALAKGMEIRYPPKTHQAPLKSQASLCSGAILNFGGTKVKSKNPTIPTVLASPNSNPNPRKAPVIKGPSKSLSMMTRAVGLILSWRNMSLRIHRNQNMSNDSDSSGFSGPLLPPKRRQLHWIHCHWQTAPRNSTKHHRNPQCRQYLAST